MKKNQKIIEEVNKTLSSIDEINNLEENPFLFSRLKAKINAGDVKPLMPDITYSIGLRIIIVLLLVINILTAALFISKSDEQQNTMESLLKVLGKEYKVDHTYYNNFIW